MRRTTAGLVKLSWFSVKRDFDRLVLASHLRHRVEDFAASCRAGFTLGCQSRR